MGRHTVEKYVDESLALREAIRRAGRRPGLEAGRAERDQHSGLVSKEVTVAIASELRSRGLKGVATRFDSKKRPDALVIAGGLGRGMVDVWYSTQGSGLVLAISIRTVSFPDPKTRNYQKSLQYERADLVCQVTGLHMRFPYAVVGGLFLLYNDAAYDYLGQGRISTLDRAHQALKIFNRRGGHRGDEAKFEYLCIGSYDSDSPHCELSEAGNPERVDTLSSFLNELLPLVAERNPEQFTLQEGHLCTPSDLGIA